MRINQFTERMKTVVVKLSNSSYVRQYGPFTYFINRIVDADRIFSNASYFANAIGGKNRSSLGRLLKHWQVTSRMFLVM